MENFTNLAENGTFGCCSRGTVGCGSKGRVGCGEKDEVVCLDSKYTVGCGNKGRVGCGSSCGKIVHQKFSTVVYVSRSTVFSASSSGTGEAICIVILIIQQYSVVTV